MHDYQSPGRSATYGQRAMCCTSHPLAAKTAIDIVERGGNAVDAAVAGAVVLGLCEPAMCGLGGDVFAMVRLPDGSLRGLNGSGQAPAALDGERLRASGAEAISTESVHAVTLPGAVDAFDRLLSTWGRLGMAEVLAPAIHYADAGVPVSRRTALDWDTFGGRLQGAGRTHYLHDDAPYRAGQVFRSPAQADALRTIAAEGRDAFYRGAIMQDMLSTLHAAGGLHTAEDFAAVSADLVDPISVDYHGYTLSELPPNGQGATALLLAKILARFDLENLDPAGAERIHLHAEATRLAYGARNRFIGDPRTSELRLAHMLSDATADQLAALVDRRRATPDIDARSEAVHTDTVYITVVDRDRLAVSLIYSTFHPFGSGLASERFGISFHNRGAGFTLREGHVNELKGGRRPLHTLIPGFLAKRDAFVMPFGVMGGPFQAAGHALLVSNMADFGMDVQEAIDCPRSFADPVTGQLQLETSIDDSVAAELSGMGHDVVRARIGIGGAQAIQVDFGRDILIGGSDQRKHGLALAI